MNNPKLARTEKWIKVELTNFLKTKIKNHKLQSITITDVKVTRDLSYATIAWTVYDEHSNIADLSAELEKAKGLLRNQLAQVSQAYKVPLLRFKYDSTEQNAQKIADILAKIKTEHE